MADTPIRPLEGFAGLPEKDQPSNLPKPEVPPSAPVRLEKADQKKLARMLVEDYYFNCIDEETRIERIEGMLDEYYEAATEPILSALTAVQGERDEAQRQLEWQAGMTKALLPYQERAVKAEAALLAVQEERDEWFRSQTESIRLQIQLWRNRAEKAEAECETLRQELADMMEFVLAQNEGRRLQNGEYPHLLICSGSRQHPPGQPGHSCCCLRPVHKAEARLTQLVTGLREKIEQETKDMASCFVCGAGANSLEEQAEPCDVCMEKARFKGWLDAKLADLLTAAREDV